MRVLIFGATGTVGAGVLLECLDNASVREVVCVGRKSTGRNHAKLRELKHQDFNDFSALASEFENVDACFWCIGIPSTGVSEVRYTEVTHDYAVAAARLLYEKSPQLCFVYVSAAGADESEKGRVMWARVKGRAENAILALDFANKVVFRPAAIVPRRGIRHQVVAYRIATWFALPLMGVMRRFGFATSTVEIGRAMIAAAQGKSAGISSSPRLESADINRLATLVSDSPRESTNKTIAWRIFTWAVWSASILVGAVLLLSLAVVIDGWTALGKAADGERLAAMQNSPQWDGDGFENPQPLWNDAWKSASTFAHPQPDRSPEAPIVLEKIDAARFKNPPSTGLRVTWLGHSTTLIEIDGVNLLTDPVWSMRPSPVQWIGPQRWFEPLIALHDLPPIDAVLISHDHYDHLDTATIQAMRDWEILFIVPMGVGAHLEYWGIAKQKIVELDWWESTRVGDLAVACTPARHASGRQIFDQNDTLWAGYAITSALHRVYFSGDTGLFPDMKRIGERYGPFDVAMIEVGAYDQAWPDWHIGPEQAVKASQWVKGNTFLPIHWGLWDLANHSWTEPMERVLVEANRRGVHVLNPRPGASVEPTLKIDTPRWWPDAKWRTAAEYPLVSTAVGDSE